MSMKLSCSNIDGEQGHPAGALSDGSDSVKRGMIPVASGYVNSLL